MDLDVITENVVELLTNSVNISSQLYDIFLNPNPMDVTIYQYNDDNELVPITIPNRAKDLTNIRTGNGSPEGSIAAPTGTLYIDSTVPQLYIKGSGDEEDGWVVIPTQTEVDAVLATYLEENNYVTENDIGNGTVYFTQAGQSKGSITMNQKGNTTIELEGPSSVEFPIDQVYNPDSTNAQSGYAIAGAGFLTEVEVDQTYQPTSANAQSGIAIAGAGFLTSVPNATSSNYGTVKYDNNSIKLNANSQLKTNGVIEQRASVNTKFWVGTQSQYNSLGTIDENTVYIITDN